MNQKESDQFIREYGENLEWIEEWSVDGIYEST